MSDGSAFLRFLDAATRKELSRIQVKDGGMPVGNLNELEYVKGEILANVWQTKRIARISPKTGAVTGWIDHEGLLTPREDQAADVLNGIAYDAVGDRLFVTGKLWPKLFEVKVQ
jgi:glutamine cyclotransferase